MVKIGRLKSLGITQLWEVPLCCPISYKDYTICFENFDPNYLYDGVAGVFKGYLTGQPETQWKNKKPRTQFTICDNNLNIIMFSMFGDTRELLKALKEGDEIAVEGIVMNNGGSKIYLNKADIIPMDALNTIMPVYKGVAGKVRPENVRKLILGALDAGIQEAGDKLREILHLHLPANKIRKFVNCSSMTLEQVLVALHKPRSLEQAREALSVMGRISHLVAASELINRSRQDKVINVNPIIGVDPKQLTARIPFKLTDEQMVQVLLAVDDIAKGNLLNALLVGDVGTGKTVVYGLIAAYVASAGGRTAIMLPNTNLARQIHEELAEYFPEYGVGLVTGTVKEDVSDKKIIVGTTALLFRDVGELDLVVCDEQQKMAISQREQLRSSKTHLLEVSATPIPRTMAFALYGAVKLLQLKHCHAKKTIHTKVVHQEEKQQLMVGIREAMSRGEKTLIVCARCEADEDIEDDPLLSAEKMFKGMDRIFPNQVVISHSKLSEEHNKDAIAKIKSGIASILVSTTVMEIGISIPHLSFLVISNAERFGLQQLHQMRGRLVRAGGVGWCSLYLPNPVKNPDTLDRMSVMENCSDGFEIARHDMMIRGTGDVGLIGDAQHGAYSTIIKNIKGSLQDIEETIEFIELLNSENENVKKVA